MEATRAALLAVAAAVGLAAPAVAQPALGDPPIPVVPPPYGIPGRTAPPAGAVHMMPPKPLAMPELPVPPVAVGGVQSTTYMPATAGAPMAVASAGPALPMPVGEPASMGQ